VEPVSARPPALVLWDVENVSPPIHVSPSGFLRRIKHAYVVDAGYREWRTVCGVTLRSLHALERAHAGFVDQVVSEAVIALASSVHGKRAADDVIRREMLHFTDPSIRRSVGDSPRIVLVTGDATYLEHVQSALRLGIDVQLIYDRECASPRLVGLPYRSAPVAWQDIPGGSPP
jgi:hypothetical protein